LLQNDKKLSTLKINHFAIAIDSI